MRTEAAVPPKMEAPAATTAARQAAWSSETHSVPHEATTAPEARKVPSALNCSCAFHGRWKPSQAGPRVDTNLSGRRAFRKAVFPDRRRRTDIQRRWRSSSDSTGPCPAEPHPVRPALAFGGRRSGSYWYPENTVLVLNGVTRNVEPAQLALALGEWMAIYSSTAFRGPVVPPQRGSVVVDNRRRCPSSLLGQASASATSW